MFFDTQEIVRVYRRVRKLKFNRNFGIFLIFLAVSTSFWVLQTLREEAQSTVRFSLEITGVPQDVVFTSELPRTLLVNLSGRGLDILQYNLEHTNKVLRLRYEDFQRTDTRISLDAYGIRRAVTKELSSLLTCNSCLPAEVSAFYTTGISKKVPVVMNGKAKVDSRFIVGRISFSPDSVDVFAPRNLYDSIKAVYTENLVYEGMERTTERRVALHARMGVKVVPDSVTMTIPVSLVTEKSVEVPIYCENIPANKVLRTFPATVKVTFQVSTADFNSVTADDFIVVVDYNSIQVGDNECLLNLCHAPDNVRHVRMSPSSVGFVIEQE